MSIYKNVILGTIVLSVLVNIVAIYLGHWDLMVGQSLIVCPLMYFTV